MGAVRGNVRQDYPATTLAGFAPRLTPGCSIEGLRLVRLLGDVCDDLNRHLAGGGVLDLPTACACWYVVPLLLRRPIPFSMVTVGFELSRLT